MQAATRTLRLVDPPGELESPGGLESPAELDPPAGLETLFRAHNNRVFRTAYRITGSPADAEDVLQTVFLRLAKGQETYDLSQNPEAYLSRAAINASLDLMRSRSRVRSVSLDDLDGILESPRQSPEAEHTDRELQRLVREAVANLGTTAAAMFVLRYYEGHDNQEIATLMDTSPMVVGVVLHRARLKLRKEIGWYMQQHQQQR